MNAGFRPSVAGHVMSQVLQMPGDRGSHQFIYSFLGRQNESALSSGSGVKDHCREVCAVAAMIEYRQAAASKQWVGAEGSGGFRCTVPERLKNEEN